MWVDHKWTLYISKVGEVQLDSFFSQNWSKQFVKFGFLVLKLACWIQWISKLWLFNLYSCYTSLTLFVPNLNCHQIILSYVYINVCIQTTWYLFANVCTQIQSEVHDLFIFIALIFLHYDFIIENSVGHHWIFAFWIIPNLMFIFNPILLYAIRFYFKFV